MAEFTTITAPACWASALVNHDRSGLDAAECAALDNWLAIERVNVVDVARNGDGEPMEPRFTTSYALYSHTGTHGGDVLDYVARSLT